MAATIGFASLYLLLISQVGDLIDLVTESVSEDAPWFLVALLHLIVGVSPAAAAWAAIRVFFRCKCEDLEQTQFSPENSRSDLDARA